MNLNDSTDGRWLTPDLLGGDIANPQSLNRYAYALNNPTTLTDPSGLGPGDPTDPSGLGGGIGECPFIWCQPDCSDFFSSGTCEPPFPPTGPISPPVGFPIGGGSGGTGGGSAPTVAVNPPAASPTGPFSGTFGGPSGFVSNAQVIEQMGVYASPWEIDVVSICVLTPGCQEAIGIAAAIGGGYLIYKGIKAGIQTHQSRGKSDPVSSLKPVNPGRDANSRCKPCPSGPGPWEVPGNAHGSTTGTHWHWIEYNQNPLTCECFPIRRSGPTAP